jgi:hypothetical protein
MSPYTPFLLYVSYPIIFTISLMHIINLVKSERVFNDSGIIFGFIKYVGFVGVFLSLIISAFVTCFTIYLVFFCADLGCVYMHIFLMFGVFTLPPLFIVSEILLLLGLAKTAD